MVDVQGWGYAQGLLLDLQVQGWQVMKQHKPGPEFGLLLGQKVRCSVCGAVRNKSGGGWVPPSCPGPITAPGKRKRGR